MTTTALAKRQSENYVKVRDLLERQKDEMAAVLPDPDRMVRVSLTSLRRNPKLLECDPLSIVKAVMEASQLNLETDGVLGMAYLVPYGDECQLLAGYKGWIELARRSGQVDLITAGVVRDGDFFEYMDVPPALKHRTSDDAADGPITHAYAWARLLSGSEQFVCWTTARIDAHRHKYSRASDRKDSAWQTAWEWMAKKTVLRQLVKLLPVSVEAQRLVARDEQIEAGVLHQAPPSNKRAAYSTLMQSVVSQPLPEVAEEVEEAGDGELFDNSKSTDAVEGGM